MHTLSIACSPDADDLFMVWALLEGLIDTGDYLPVIETAPTDGLNTLSLGHGPEVCAISMAHYPAVANRYQLLPHGGSMGEGYGPVVIARESKVLADLKGCRMGVPGLRTTAYTTLRMVTEVVPVVIPIAPYSLLFDALDQGSIDAALVIHEGRLTFAERGFAQVLDLGVWWAGQTGGLPLPLGVNVIRRDLNDTVVREVSDLLRRSIRYGLDHVDRAVDWLLARGGALDTPHQVKRYLSMYANERTYDYGPKGRQGIAAYLERAAGEGLLPACHVDFAP